jgi:hypothetical protein
MIILLNMKAVGTKYLSSCPSGIDFYLYHHRAVSSMNPGSARHIQGELCNWCCEFKQCFTADLIGFDTIRVKTLLLTTWYQVKLIKVITVSSTHMQCLIPGRLSWDVHEGAKSQEFRCLVFKLTLSPMLKQTPVLGDSDELGLYLPLSLSLHRHHSTVVLVC